MVKYPDTLPDILSPDEYINVRQAARLTGLATGTLNQKRHHGGGPKFEKRGKKVVYQVKEIRRWSRQTAI